ncbi:hypothetical protein EJ02DRAFT_510827 [Clathrospora elynae]|uniref:Uncharacterized protein n=1 Tax=Clathrospora elynae TaxID=706981 RepID=A0A6A5SV40_9PLEO|nr:hypothetical protein EJ02DRAFT_510827 [Clathrospora elynae]
MAGFIAISIGLGVEKLGRTISDKRLVRKEKKTIAQHEAIYGNAESSSSAPAMTTRERQSRTDRKREEAQREFREAHHEQHDVPQYKARRRSLSAERVGEEGPPPPSYDSVVRQDGRRV